MLQTLTIYTERGKPDSIRDLVKIVFTITPAESKRHTWNFYPLEYDTMIFGNMGLGESKETKWNTELEVQLYKLVRTDNRSYYSGIGRFQNVPLGQARTITKPVGSTEVQWGPAEPYNDRIAHLQSSIMVVNKTGSPQNIALCCKRGGELPWWTMAAYHQVSDGECIIAPSELELQAYVANIATNYDSALLLPEDMTRPLFSVPLSCDTLPATSKWKLSQDKGGAFHLTNDKEPEHVFYSAKANAERLERLMTTHADGLSDRVSAVEDKTTRLAATLDRIETRLAAVEMLFDRAQRTGAAEEQHPDSITKRISKLETSDEVTRTDMAIVQKSLVNVRLQLDDVAAKKHDGGTKAAELTKAFDQTQTELSVLRESIGVTGAQMTGLDRRIAAIEAKSEKLMAMLEGGSEDDREILFAQGDSSVLARSRENTSVVFPAKSTRD